MSGVTEGKDNVVVRQAVIAIGLVGLANIFDPALIAISGGLVNDGELFLDPIRRHFLGHIEGADYRPAHEPVVFELT